MVVFLSLLEKCMNLCFPNMGPNKHISELHSEKIWECYWSSLITNLVYLGGNFCSTIFHLKQQQKSKTVAEFRMHQVTEACAQGLPSFLSYAWFTCVIFPSLNMQVVDEGRKEPGSELLVLRHSALCPELLPTQQSWDSAVLPKASSHVCKASWHHLGHYSVSPVLVSKRKQGAGGREFDG